MVNAQVKERVNAIVNAHQGLKSPELFAILSVEFIGLSKYEVASLIEEMVGAGLLIEVEYCLPDSKHRSRQFYLPKGSSVNP